MYYENSYDVALKPFNHDKSRGKWSSPIDFFYACLVHGFKIDAILVMPSLIFGDLGIYCLIPYLIVLVTCVTPIIFIQSFLGQFSSTGFISVFRIAPLFKSIGYVSLAINLTTLTYYSLFGAIPLYFFFYSLRPTLPWSCEGAKEWMKVPNNTLTPCLDHDTIKELLSKNKNYMEMKVPSYEFFNTHMNLWGMSKRGHPEGTFSWPLMICTCVLWIMMGAILTKPIETVARFIRYSCLAVVGTLCLLLLRLAFIPGAFAGLRELFAPPGLSMSYIDVWAVVPLMAFAALGPGWGSILTMASYNDFKTNIFKFSWLLSLAQFGILLGLAVQEIFIRNFLQRPDPNAIHFQYMHTQWMEFLVAPTTLSFLEVPHFWSIIFFCMMILGTLNLLIVQLLSVLTSIFDEFESLRSRKTEVTLVAVAGLALCSLYFCSNHGITFSELLAKFSTISQMALNLMLLLVVLWIYGRERFQRDVILMTSRTYPTWMVNIVRFIAPVFLLLSLAAGSFLTFWLGYSSWFTTTAVIAVVLLPWSLVPGYCIFKLLQTSGALGIRFRGAVRPTDWYPVDPIYKEQYEETFSQSDVSQHLTTTTFGT